MRQAKSVTHSTGVRFESSKTLPLKASTPSVFKMKPPTILSLMIASLAIFPGCRPDKHAAENGGVLEQSIKTAEIPIETEMNPVHGITRSAASFRAQNLGFAGYLPNDIECLMTWYNPSDTIDRLGKSKLWEFLHDQAASPELHSLLGLETTETTEKADHEDGQEVVDAATGSMYERNKNLFQNEVTIAIGTGSARPLGNLVNLLHRLRISFHDDMASLFSGVLERGEPEAQSKAKELSGHPMLEHLLRDEEFRAALSGILDLPPVYLAFSTNPETRQEDIQEINDLMDIIGFLGEMVSSFETSVADSKFSGKVIHGKKIAELLESMRPMIVELLGDVATNLIIEDISHRELVIVSGTIGDYLVLFFGSSQDQFNLVTDVEESLGASEAFQFIDPFMGKDLVAVVHGADKLIDALFEESGISRYAKHAKPDDGHTALQNDPRREADHVSKSRSDDDPGWEGRWMPGLSAIAYFEDGLRIESFGKSNAAGMDHSASSSLGGPVADGGFFIFANLNVDRYNQEAVSDYCENIFDSIRDLTARVFAENAENPDYMRLAEAYDFFESEVGEDLSKIWNTIHGKLNHTLGGGRTWIMDFHGAMPDLPMIPKPLIDHGGFPRLTVLAPVSDRAEFAQAWQEIHEATQRIAEALHEKNPRAPSSLQTIASTHLDLTTWYYPMPFLRDGFRPSITVGESWIAASTCEKHAIHWIQRADSSPHSSNESTVVIDFKELQAFIDRYGAVLQDNSELFDSSETQIQSIRRASMALSELDVLRVIVSHQNGSARSSMHFKFR